jgi:lysozyme
VSKSSSTNPNKKEIRQLVWISLAMLALVFIVRNYQPALMWFRYQAFFKGCPGNNYKRYDNFNIHLPTGYSVHGIDVSHFCCEIDWNAVANVNIDSVTIRFAFMRATMGESGTDFQFGNNWKNAKKNHIIRGAYHYYYPWQDPTRQAYHFLRHCQVETGDLPPVLDIETTEGITLPELIRDIKIWLEIVEQETGIKPILYTNMYHLEKYFSDRFKEYPLWIANYQNNSLSFTIERQWLFWQHSNTGRINGSSEPVDFNVFNGTYEELLMLCKR